MPPKPTYEELENRIAELEAERAERIRAEDDLNAIFSMSLDLLCIADIQTATFFKVNPAFVETLGYGEQELLGQSLLDFIHPEDVEQTRSVLKQSLKKGSRVTKFRNRCRCKDGSYRWFSWTSHPAPDKGVTYAVAHDITEEIRIQEENLKRKRFLESLLYHAPDAIVTLDSEHRVMDWNPGAVAMFGYTPEEAIGRPLDELVARGKKHAEACRKTRQVLSGRRLEAFETVRYRKDGSPLRVIAAGSPIMVDGVLTGVVAVYTDISERVAAEAALMDSEEKFRALVEQSPLGIVLIQKGGRYRYTNPEFQRMFGYTTKEVPNGAAWLRKAFPNKAERDVVVRSWIEDFTPLTAGRTAARVFTVTCRDGSRKQIQFRAVTMENLDRFVICEDVTEKTKLAQQLQQAQKFEAIGTLAAGVAHDFNNLLMGIQGRASLMSVDLGKDHPHVRHVSAIEAYIRSAADLTNQLLGFARGGKYEVRPIDVNQLLGASAAMFGRTRKEIRIHTRLREPPPVVSADRRQIEQVFLNLFVNAWQAMPSGGELFLETRTLTLDEAFCRPHQVVPGRYVKIVVTDTGVGMSESIRQRIFDPFFTTKGQGRGTGLGLASAYGIIKNHGGIITVSSEVGHGATFAVYLPLTDGAPEAERTAPSRLHKGSETLLLVDDEEMILEVGQAMLETLGYRVLVARGGKEALAAVAREQGRIDLVILDLIMPGSDGGMVFDRIREIDPAMPVILSSGYSLNGQAQQIIQRGCNGFIQKPFNISELSQKIRKVLDPV